MDGAEATITHLERGFDKGGGLPGCRVILSDGSSWFILLSHADALSLYPGRAVSPELREELRLGTLRREISLKSLDLLARRDHSRLELRRKLEKRYLAPDPDSGSPGPDAGYIRDSIGQALDALTERGYLNDLRFAENWVASRLRKRPEGRGALEAGLRARGISRQAAGEILDRVFDTPAEQEALARAAEKLARRGGITREKLISRLVARGFAYGRAREWAEAAGIPSGREAGEEEYGD